MLSQITTPARPLSFSAGGGSEGGGSGLSSTRARSNGGVRLLWRGAFEFGEGVILDGVAFISHLSFPSATPSSASAKLGPSAVMRSPVFLPRGSASTTPSLHSSVPRPSSSPQLSSLSSQADPSTLTKPKPKRAVLFSSGVESITNPAVISPSSQADTRGNTPKTSSQSFPTTIPSPSPFPLTSPTDLLLSLALESLKGRPSIRYRGLVRIGVTESQKEAGAKAEGLVEGEGGVRLYTDPRCPLVLNFLRRQLLFPLPNSSSDTSSLTSTTSSPLDSSGRTTHGILIGLGDESVESSNLIIYALLAPQPPSSFSAATSSPQTITLHLGRYNPSLLTPAVKAPRPDDPAPRRAPLSSLNAFAATKEREMEKAVSAGGKRKAVSAAAVGAGDKKFKSNTIGRKEKAREEEEAASSVMEVDEDEQDVFGSTKGGSVAPSDGGGKRRVSLVGAVSVKEESVDEAGEVIKESSAKEKEKETVTASGGGGRKKVSAQETHNKAHIKTATLQALLERDITKEHPEFKELWNWVVRGSGFALRSILATKIITALEVQRVVGAHLELYLPVELPP